MTRLRTVLAIAVLFTALAVGVAGCSGSDGSTDAAGLSASPEVADRAGEAPAAKLVVDIDGKKIRTGTVALEAARDDVAGAADRVAAIAEAAGGSVDEQRSTGGRRPSSDLVVRVPPDRFRDVIGQIEEVATVRSSESETRDVTGQYSDLDGRLAAMRISVERLRGFLGKATDVNQIASLEGELTRREAELESTQGQLDALSAQVEMATIRVALTTAPPVVASGSEPPSPAGALVRGWDAFVTAIRYLAAGIALGLPFLVVAATAVLVGRRVRRPTPVSG